MENSLDTEHILATLTYSGIGVVVFVAAFLVMVKLTPFSVQKEIEEDQNVALAVVMGAVILGLAIIISATVGA